MPMPWLSSTLSFTKPTVSRVSLISSRIGETRRHGTHHGAQKSTITGLSALRTSLSNVASVTSATAINCTSKYVQSLFRHDSLSRYGARSAGGLGPNSGRRRRPDPHCFGELLGPPCLEDAGA